MIEGQLFSFMKQLQHEMATEYKRIQKNVLRDPGTAGDEGEENWAKLLRGWLPANYSVVTKGRIIDVKGHTSPQVDILVLHPSYPKHLVNKKHYLAGGVVAAFECKLTLRTQHLEKAFKTAVIIKNLVKTRTGTPYKELNQPIFYGLLAHSYSWKKSKQDVAFDLLERIQEKQFAGRADHPNQLLDFICVSDLGTYALSKSLHFDKSYKNLPDEQNEDIDIEFFNHISTCYTCQLDEEAEFVLGSVLGAFVSELMIKLAYEDKSLQAIAKHYFETLWNGGIGITTAWYPDILSPIVVKQLRDKGPEQQELFSEWNDSV